jgi:hypothetical protein
VARANKALDTSITTVEVLEELTPDEERERHRLEIKIDRAISESWLALKQLRDRRLYRSTHKTFDEYALERFGYNRAHAYRLINAAVVLENLSLTQIESDLSPNWRQKLPISESQCRELAKLPSKQQPIAWEQVLEVSNGKAPTAKAVRSVVEQIKERPLFLATDFCSPGEVFTLTKLLEHERKYNGYPCVAVELKHFTIDVDVYNATLSVKPENLKKIDDPNVRRQLPAIIKRIKRLQQYNLDRSAYPILDLLGKRTYLTSFEDKLLTLMEHEHGIESNS